MRETLRRFAQIPDRLATAVREMTHDLRSVLITVGVVVLVMALAFAGSWLSDRAAGGPASRNAAAQSAQNGRNLCEFNNSLAMAFATFAQESPQLSPEAEAAIANLVQTAAECKPEAPREQTFPLGPPEEP